MNYLNLRKYCNGMEKVCKEISMIAENQVVVEGYECLRFALNSVLSKKLNYLEIDTFCNTLFDIATIKNRKLRTVEKYCWEFINDIPITLHKKHNLKISEDEILDDRKNYSTEEKKILSRLIKLSKETLDLPDAALNGSSIRRTGALTLLSELSEYYKIANVKQFFINSIKSKKEEVQYEALIGLMNYYDQTEAKIDKTLIKILDEIIEKTKIRTILSTCLQIKINAGIINEVNAVMIMDEWKDKYYFR